MSDQNSRSERKSLLVSTIGNLVVGCVGIFFAAFSSSQAIMLDALRAKTLDKLQDAHPATALDMIFTADPTWGALTKLRVKVSRSEGKKLRC